MALLLGIDLGTTACRAVVYEISTEDAAAARDDAIANGAIANGAIANGADATPGNPCCRAVGESYLEYGLITRSSSIIEQDPLAWWELSLHAMADALSASRRDPADVRAIAVSSQGIAFVLLNGDGEPLGNAISWLDSRATAECAEILARYPADYLFHKTGKRAAPFYVLPKLLWLRQNCPDTWRSANRLLMGHDYLVYRLCGACVTDHSMAGGTLLYDLEAKDWSSELLDAFGLARELLPDLRWSGTVAGTVLPEVAERLGLRPDTVVAVGGQDQKCAALGAGIAEHTATVSLGTASAIVQLMAAPLTDSAQRIPTFAFVQPGRWVLEGVVGTAAGSLRWYRDTLASGVSYQALDVEAASIEPGSDGVLFYPHLSGAGSPTWRSAARATFHGLNLASRRGHLTRAVLEGVAYQIRANLAITESIAGQVEQVVLFGGGARSPLWRSILGNVLGRRIAATDTVETAGLGAAMLAGAACGLFGSLVEAQARLLPAVTFSDPDPAAVADYSAHYERYRQIEAALLSLPDGIQKGGASL